MITLAVQPLFNTAEFFIIFMHQAQTLGANYVPIGSSKFWNEF